MDGLVGFFLNVLNMIFRGFVYTEGESVRWLTRF